MPFRAKPSAVTPNLFRSAKGASRLQREGLDRQDERMGQRRQILDHGQRPRLDVEEQVAFVELEASAQARSAGRARHQLASSFFWPASLIDHFPGPAPLTVVPCAESSSTG